MSNLLHKLRCCNRPSRFRITYDVDLNGEETYEVCEEHYKKPIFSKYVISIIDLQDGRISN